MVFFVSSVLESDQGRSIEMTELNLQDCISLWCLLLGANDSLRKRTDKRSPAQKLGRTTIDIGFAICHSPERRTNQGSIDPLSGMSAMGIVRE